MIILNNYYLTINNLTIFYKVLIKQWAKLFVDLFKDYSPSGLQLPKLHNWCYHAIPAIIEYNAINAFATETYEYLHKMAVKDPYRSSNNRQATMQIIQNVKHFF